jgi:tRNA(fMet)-specific endonuclease VapC
MDEVLVDTDMLSEALKAKDARVLARTQQYLSQHGRLAFSTITFYENWKGPQLIGPRISHTNRLT